MTTSATGLEGKTVEMLHEVALRLPEEQRADLLVESVRTMIRAATGGSLLGPYIHPEREGLTKVLDAALAHQEETRQRGREREERARGH